MNNTATLKNLQIALDEFDESEYGKLMFNEEWARKCGLIFIDMHFGKVFLLVNSKYKLLYNNKLERIPLRNLMMSKQALVTRDSLTIVGFSFTREDLIKDEEEVLKERG